MYIFTHIYTHRCSVYLAIMIKEIQVINLRVDRNMSGLRENISCIVGERNGYGVMSINNLKAH